MTGSSARALDDTARHWVVQLSSDEVTVAEKAEFDAWLAANPDHQSAYEEARRVWSGVEQLSHLKGTMSVDDLDKFAVSQGEKTDVVAIKRGRFQSAFIASGLAAAAAILLAVFIINPSDSPVNEFRQDYATDIAEVRDIDLHDGSQITLGARSSVKVDYTSAQRRVALLSGEAFFSVSKDADRPFFVTAGETVVRVVGTKFEVRRGVEEIKIAVAEGIVEVSSRDEQPLIEPSGKSITKTTVTAGQQIITVHTGQLTPIREISEDAPGAWREGRLFYEDVSLTEVVADANRYYPGHIELASEEVGELRITGSFRTDGLERMLVNLEETLPIRLERMGRTVVIRQ